MARYTVTYETLIGAGIQVDANTTAEAIETADSVGLPGLCHHCTGTSRRWWRDDPDEWTPVTVYDTTGKDVWSDSGIIEQAIARELRSLADGLAKAYPVAAQQLRTRADALDKTNSGGQS